MIKNFNDFINEIYVGTDYGTILDVDNATKDAVAMVTKINDKYKLNIDDKKYKFTGLSEDEKNIRLALIAKSTEYFGVQGTENKITNAKFMDFLREYTESQYAEYSYTFINAIVNKLKNDNPEHLRSIESTYKKGAVKSIKKGSSIPEFLTGDVYFYTSNE